MRAYVGIILVARVQWQQFMYSSDHKLSSALPAHLDHKYSCKHAHIFALYAEIFCYET